MSTPRIHVLDAALADQIAAGEVVERPASVVKELLENALDASATRIEVEIVAGGCERIRVVDDGHGMERSDALLSLQRHATSKLRTRDDLFRLGTLGFRGEALPSIASVAKLRLTTRTRAAAAATRVTVEGGGEPVVDEVGSAPGTIVEVSDLFYNVPARRKFLKARSTESGHVASTVVRTALAHPQVAIVLVREGRKARELLKAASFVERARAVFPEETLGELEAERDGITVIAALAPPERARSGATGLHLYVNGRPVRDVSLARAIAFAYGSVMPPGRYPVGVLEVRLDPSLVDVNVHPQKHEVRFARGRQVYDSVTRMLAKGLGTTAWGGPAARGAGYWDRRLGGQAKQTVAAAEDSPDHELAGAPLAAAGVAEAALADWGLAPSPGEAAANTPDATTHPSEPRGLLDATGFFGSLRVVGQVRRMLLVCEGKDALHVIDQHAADERVRYDSLRKAYAGRTVRTQRLLFPERVECTEADASLVSEHREQLLRVGLECELLGARTIAIHAVPALLSRAPPERLLRDLLGELSGRGERSFGDAVDMALATMACHGAIRAGDPLSPQEAATLLASMDRIEQFAGHCPHGRPVLLSLPFTDLERRLGR